MPNKSFSIYSPEEFAVEENDQLILEIAQSHLACIVTKENKTVIAACEFFTFTQDEGSKFDNLFNEITRQSKILSRTQSSVRVYINNEYCIPVPIFNFNKDIAAELLEVVYGEDLASAIQFQHVPVEPGIINVYRVRQDVHGYLQRRFQKVTLSHAYSNIIRRATSHTSGHTDELITIQFYNTFMIVVVVKNGGLQLIQTFMYETPEDVLYYLLNITRQFELFSERLTLKISGMIDVEFKLYRELITYFKRIVLENEVGPNAIPDLGEHPVHYFTPFFNLAL